MRTKAEDTYIPDDDTDTEEDVARFVRPRPPLDPSQVYSIRIPSGALDQLRRLAAIREMAPTALIREWTLDRLTAELGGEPAPSQYQVLTDRIIHLEQKLVEQQKQLEANTEQTVKLTVRAILEDDDLRALLEERKSTALI